jgi:hypothetical protein
MTAAQTTTTQTTATGWVLRIGSTAGIAGALLAMVGNLIHPATPIGDPEGWPPPSPTAGSGSPATSRS